MRWLTAAAVLATVAINLAGIGAIAVAQRGAVEEAGRLLRLETAAQAGELESALASARADLAFMTGSPIFFGLESALGSRNPTEARWRRLEAEGALLIYLRGHPEITRLQARSEENRILVAAARRGGVPVLWTPLSDSEAGETPAGSIHGRFEFTTGVRRVSGAVALEATLDPGRLLARTRAGDDRARRCSLIDRDDLLLGAWPEKVAAAVTTPPQPAAGGDGSMLSAEAEIRTENWSAPSPWRLRCVERRTAAVGLVASMAARYRTTLVLNLGVMSLAILLGMFAIQQSRRRQALEASAHAEVRVRDLERQLFHAERLGTVGRLAAGMAHEINNPLEGLSNYLSLLRNDLARGDAATGLRRLDRAQEGLSRAADIVRRVLQHADPAAAPRVALDLNDVARETLEFVHPRPEFRAIRFDLDLHPAPLRVRGNRVLLGQVFLNLILNACEAQPSGGEVRVATRTEAEHAIAEIADRGPGVPPTDGSRIFEPFYSTKRSTGLGLSICFSIMNQHGGDLGLMERPGGGALFRMRFPIVEREEP